MVAHIESDKPLPLIIDDREPSYVSFELRRRGLDTKVEQLPSGDYVLGEIAIERKSYTNFNHDLSFRIWNQLNTMAHYFKYPILLIEGWATKSEYKPININDPLRGARCTFNYPKCMGALSMILKKYKVPIWRTENLEDTINFLHALYKKYYATPSGRIPLPKIVKQYDVGLLRIGMLTCVPGIGQVTARRILKEFTMEDLGKVEPKMLVKKVPRLRKKPALLLYKVFSKEGGE